MNFATLISFLGFSRLNPAQAFLAPAVMFSVRQWLSRKEAADSAVELSTMAARSSPAVIFVYLPVLMSDMGAGRPAEMISLSTGSSLDANTLPLIQVTSTGNARHLRPGLDDFIIMESEIQYEQMTLFTWEDYTVLDDYDL